MKIDRELVARVAELSALELSPDESEAIASQLTRIVEHFEALQAIPDALLPEAPIAPPTPLREDAGRLELPAAVLEKNAPEISHGHFVVPRVVSRDE